MSEKKETMTAKERLFIQLIQSYPSTRFSTFVVDYLCKQLGIKKGSLASRSYREWFKENFTLENHCWCRILKTSVKSFEQATIEERGKVYGDPYESHKNIGLSWTGLLQQHYGITLPHPLPASLIAQMMTTFKVQRSCRVYKDDNYLDARVYNGFAEEFQKKEQNK